MTESQKNAPSKEAQIMLDSLQRAVTDTLEKKRRLGQYAVVWRDGKPVILNFDVKPESETPAEESV